MLHKEESFLNSTSVKNIIIIILATGRKGWIRYMRGTHAVSDGQVIHIDLASTTLNKHISLFTHQRYSHTYVFIYTARNTFKPHHIANMSWHWFSAVQNRSVGDLVPWSVGWAPLTIRVTTTIQSIPDICHFFYTTAI